jgi:Amt family ammonium transporter
MVFSWLVGVTAGCAAFSPVGAALIGLICGTVVVFAIEFIDKKIKSRRSSWSGLSVQCLCL